jgi:hypothetical protein
MTRLRKMALVALVWLTSALTVAAGVPETICGCRERPMRAAGKGAETAKCKCECGGECCSADGGSCCASRDVNFAQPSAPESRITAPSQGRAMPSASAKTSRCTRILVTNPTPLGDDGKTKAPGKSTLSPFAAALCHVDSEPVSNSSPGRSLERPAHVSNQLLTALQHFNI